MKSNLRSFSLVTVLVLSVCYLPIYPPYELDFHAFYRSIVGFLHGLPLYDEKAIYFLFADRFGDDPTKTEVLPSAYPPWYYLSTVYLGFFPIQTAAKIWFHTNLLMLCVSGMLLSSKASFSKCFVLLPLLILFPPAFGLMMVGQLTMPVVLGSAFLVWGWSEERPWALAFGLTLLTFKPHMGFLILVVGILSLARRPDSLKWRTFRYSAILWTVILICSFAVEPGWPREYFSSIGRVSTRPANLTCYNCSHLSIILGNILDLSQAGKDQVALFIFGLFSIMTISLALLAKSLNKQYEALLSIASLSTILSAPYSRNYDYVLLILPIIALTRLSDNLRYRLLNIMTYIFMTG